MEIGSSAFKPIAQVLLKPSLKLSTPLTMRKKFDVPTLILHGDDDQIVPIGAAALASSKLVGNATLKVYKGAPHGLTDTHKVQLNADLLAFVRA